MAMNSRLQIGVDTAKLKNTRARLTLPDKHPFGFSDCTCTNCSLTVRMDDFQEQRQKTTHQTEPSGESRPSRAYFVLNS